MIMYIKNLYTVKKAETALKASLYGNIAALTDNQQEIIDLIKNVYISFKDVPACELRSELIGRIADLAYGQAVKERESGKHFQ